MTYRVFICHSYGHRDIYYELIQKLSDAKYFDWRNVSVQYDMRFGTADEEIDNEELRGEICNRIRDCEVFLALTKPVASRRRWLQLEIRHAKELGKPIIGIARRRNDRVSSFVKQHADDIVDTWRIDHIVNAIKIYANEYRMTSGVIALPPPASLPQEEADAEIDAEPSPAAPDESDEGPPPKLPRDVLFRDPLGTYVPGTRPTQSPRQPRWWWPFAQRDAHAKDQH